MLKKLNEFLNKLKNETVDSEPSLGVTDEVYRGSVFNLPALTAEKLDKSLPLGLNKRQIDAQILAMYRKYNLKIK